MTTVEREREQKPHSHELPVFVTGDGRRARRLRLVASAIAALALLWLAALAVGMIGFGRLPGLSTPLGRIGGQAKAESNRSDSKAGAQKVRSEGQRAALIGAQERSGRTSTPERPAGARVAVERAQARARVRRPRTQVPPVAVQPVQPQPAPTQTQQGWARHGRPAPPGYTRRTEPQPAPPAPPGQAQAPGQVKKALAPPPPPPPPPPGNGGGSKKG